MTSDHKPAPPPPEAVTASLPTVGAVIAEWPANGLPYPWCWHPDACRGRSTCVRDPNCGE